MNEGVSLMHAPATRLNWDAVQPQATPMSVNRAMSSGSAANRPSRAPSIRKSGKRTRLWDRLEKLRYSDQHVERDYDTFKVRIWRIE